MNATVRAVYAIALLVCCAAKTMAADQGTGFCVTLLTDLGPMVLTPDGQKLYVADTVAARVLVVSTLSNKVKSETTVSGPVKSIAITPDGLDVLVVSQTKRGEVVDVIGTQDDHLKGKVSLGSGEFSRIAAGNHDLAYVLRTDAPSIFTIELSHMAVTERMNLQNSASDIVWADNHLYIAASKLLDLNTRTGNLSSLVTLPATAVRLEVSADRQIIAASLLYGNDVLFFDTKSVKLLHQVAVGLGIEDTAFSPDGKMLFATYQVAGMTSHRDPKSGKIASHIEFAPMPVVAIDVVTGRILKKIAVGEHAKHLAVSPDGKKIFVSTHDKVGLQYIAVVNSEHATQRISVAPQKSGDSSMPCHSERRQ